MKIGKTIRVITVGYLPAGASVQHLSPKLRQAENVLLTTTACA